MHMIKIAHAHHLYYQVTHSGMSKRNAMLTVTFQLLYTTLFGFLSAFVFLRTGHVMAAIVMHVFCNSLGFPRFSWCQRLQTPRDFVNCIVYFVGLIGFCALFVPWTEPHMFQSPFYGY